MQFLKEFFGFVLLFIFVRKIFLAKLLIYSKSVGRCKKSNITFSDIISDSRTSLNIAKASKKYSSNSSFVYLVLTYLPPTIAICSFLYKLLIQKEINHIDIQNTVIIIPTLSNIFPYHNFRKRISCKCKWSEFYFSFFISRHRIR